jgi:hypothetical protein
VVSSGNFTVKRKSVCDRYKNLHTGENDDQRKKEPIHKVIDALTDADEKEALSKAVSAPKNVVVTVRNLRVHADHDITSEVVAGVANGDEVHIDSTWSDGRITWAKLEQGWAVMVYDGETYIKPA